MKFILKKKKDIHVHIYNNLKGRVRFIQCVGLIALASKNAILFFFYHLKKQLYCLYHTILQFLPHKKTLFLLKYYYFIFLYYFFLSDIA